MPAHEVSPEAARAALIRLIEADEWEVTASAVSDARPILLRAGLPGTTFAVVEYVLRLLKDGFPMHPLPLGEPPGSAGTAYVMNNADGQGLYIKVKIERER